MRYVFTLILLTSTSFAHLNTITFFKSTYVSRSINLEKNVLRFGFDFGFKNTDKLYNRQKKLVLSSNSSSARVIGLDFITEYGATNNLSFGLAVPVLYRTFDNGSEDTSSYGLGDARAFSFFQVYGLADPLLSTGIFFGIKFPSGKTASFDDAQNLTTPLGNGVIEVEAGPETKFEFAKNLLSIRVGGTYTLKMATVAEYSFITVTDASGTTQIGNNEVNFGDSLKAFAELGMQWGRSLFVGVDSQIFYNLRTTVGGSGITYDSSDPSAKSSTGYMLELGPLARMQLSDSVEAHIANRFPIYGKTYPVVDFAIANNFIGSINLVAGLSFYF
jgi:hypothetical protein